MRYCKSPRDDIKYIVGCAKIIMPILHHFMNDLNILGFYYLPGVLETSPSDIEE
jgi:hypothetical protein